MSPAVLIFLLYVLIVHELVTGLLERRHLASKPHGKGLHGIRAAGRPAGTSMPIQGWRLADVGKIGERSNRDYKKSSSRFVRKV